MGLDFSSEFLKMLYDGAINGASKIGVLVCDDASFVSDCVVDILETALAEELVARAEGNLYDGAESSELLCSVVLDVGNALKIGDELLDDGFPSDETLDKDIRGTKVLGSNVFLYEGLIA